MKTLEEIKEEYAKGWGYSDWVSFINDLPNHQVETAMNDIAKRYATEAIKADRERVAKKAKVKKTANSGSYLDASVDKESIINLPIELP